MAIMTDIPTMPAPRSATPGPKGETVAKGTKEGFQTALNEENLRQAGSVAEKSEKEQENELLSGAEQAVAAAAIGAADAPPAATLEITVVAGDAPAVPTVDPPAPEAAAAENISLASASGEERKAALPADETAETAAPAGEKIGQAFPQQETVSGTRPAAVVKQTPETAVMPDRDTTPSAVAEAAPSPAEHQSPDIMETLPGKTGVPQAKGLFKASAATAASDTAQQVIAQLQRPAQDQAGSSQSETGRKGLLEASFAGILQSPAAKGQPLKWNPAPEPKADAVGVLPEDGQPEVSQAIRSAAGGEAGSDPSDALLKQASGRSESLKAGEGQSLGDQGQTSVFDSVLASANTGKTVVEGQPGPVQGAAPENASPTASSLNQEVRILDQVLDQMPLNRIGDKSRFVIRLHPEELGEVKLDLVMEKDQLKAHLVTQTQQVQEILEKHLPRLQEALHNQGVKLDNIQVSVDSRGSQGREFFNRDHQSAPFARSFGHHRTVPEPAQAAASTDPIRASGGGLSLRI